MERIKSILPRIRDKAVKNKRDILAVSALFLVSLIFFKNIIGTETLMDNGHYLHEQTFFSYNYKTALEDRTLPFWTQYWYSGQPLFGDSQVFFANLTLIFIILFKNIFLAINLSTLAYFFIAGMGMYFLMRHLAVSRMAAFAASLVYMFNGLIYHFVKIGNPSILEPYSLIPTIFLFAAKAVKSKNPVFYSALAGIFMAFQIFSGGGQVFIYTGLLVGLYLAFSLIGKNFRISLIRALAVGLIALLFLFGLSAAKLLPSLDFMKQSNRAGGVSYQEYIGSDHFAFKDFFKVVVLNKISESTTAHIGIVAFLLALLSLGLWKKKMVIFFFLTALFALLLGSGGFLAELFFKYVPVFSQTRHIGRVLLIFVFAGSALAGYGLSYAYDALAGKIRGWGKIKNLVFVFIILLIMAELVFAKGLPRGFNIKEQLEENKLAEYLSQQDEKFRITAFDVTDFVSFYGSSYYAQYGLETVSGGGGVWFNDIVRHLAIAKAYNNSKLLGILNLRYATSFERADAPGFREIKKFEDCISCNASGWTYWIAGPYLYENEDFLPRYYMANNSVLVVGGSSQALDVIYGILVNRNFNPKNTVIIQGEHSMINKYEIGFLKKFDAIILLQNSADSNSFPLLQQYSDAGGKIFPDILSNKESFDFSEIENMLGSFGGSLTEVDSESFSANEIVLNPKERGFLVLSERFAMFDGWSAEKNGSNIGILMADGIISSVYVDSPGAIRFKYKPKPFGLGLAISSATLSIICLYGLFSLRKKWINSKKAAQQN